MARDLPSRELLERLGQVGYRLGTRSFLVGGPVRDLLLGRAGPKTDTGAHHKGTRTQCRPESGTLVTSCLGGSVPGPAFLSDIDIAVEDRPREFGNALAREFGGRFVYHDRFMTGTVSFAEPQASGLKLEAPKSGPSSPAPGASLLSHIDITQTRTEVYVRPAVLPQVKPASIKSDLARRDFSVNAMALEITPGAFGTFIDPHNGREDLESRRIRILHDRSFIDDPTRIFRCIRFAVRLGFEIAPGTLELMRAAIAERYPALLTPERVLYELRTVCAEPLVLPMVEAICREKMLAAAWRWTPPRGFLAGLAKLASSLPASSLRPALLFIYWLSVLPVTDRFPVRKEERDAAEAVAGAARLRPRLKRKLKPSEIVQALRSVPEPALRILAVLESKTVSANLLAYLDSYRRVRIAATGADLRAAGLKPGPAYRVILDKLLFARLDGRIRTVTEEQALLRRLAARNKDN